METTKIETLTGKLKRVSAMKETKIPNRYTIGILVDANGKPDWYNSFGQEEVLNKLIARLEKDSDVTLQFKTKGLFKELVSIKPVVQGNLISPAPIPAVNDSLVPVSQTWHMVENGILNMKKLKMALKCLECDFRFLHEELDRVDMDENETDA